MIIPVHADRGTCRAAVESALAQSLPPLEVIVVDDGSDPPLPQIHDDPRVRQFRLERCRGPSAARNRAVSEACGEWIAFLDSDDLWHPDKLKRQLSARTGQDDCVLACNVEVVGGAAPRPYNRTTPVGDLGWWVLVEGGGFQTSGLMLPRGLALGFPFDERLAVYEDWDLVLRLEQVGHRFEYLPDCLVTYRVAAKRHRTGGDWLDRRAAWLVDPANPAQAQARYYHYLIEVAPMHLRQRPGAALAVLARLARQTGRPLRATAGALRTAWQLRSERKRRGALG